MEVDEILGSYHNRYFGSGYQKGQYQIIDQDNHNVKIRVSYPGGWSKKQASERQPHLSTIDGVIVAALISERLLGEQSYEYYLSGFEIKAGNHEICLDHDLTVQIGPSHVTAQTGNFQFDVEGMKIKLQVTHSQGKAKVKSHHYLTEHLKANRLHLGELTYLGQSGVSGVVNYHQDSSLDYDGLGSGQAQVISIIEWLVIFSQMGELMAYHYDSLNRDDCNNLWMKSIKASLSDPIKVNQPIRIMSELVKVSLINKDNQNWRVLKAHGSDINNQVKFEAKMAHLLPAEWED
ncbi:MAG: AvrD family protein [Limosilactobacillus gorillae]|jgi:hypothetical protein|uniref:AvrD family protein n=1 Tax=Limosilactobacillus gorillae TaxID=1450649 RepID=UPI000B18FA74|nr:AvrD family protein [Limosilactobacillus gorillae]MDO4855545.1 AvrD family protein [Limosilactobacillus gorillae]